MWHGVLYKVGVPRYHSFTGTIILLNETPQFLTKQGQVEEAKVVPKRIQKFGAEEELQQLAYLIENEDREPWQKLLHSPVLVINVAAQIF
ncbi:hypothetical protein H5410_002323 [Solanum commersonii]|uniref:Uncharacterized protein n=1 Tax=Solanum commersonii TaxID=4109 RepID=A0A9J6B1K5_SOLCO|nr:hypothetical protein H5410_002323 [Solanum commersonii]